MGTYTKTMYNWKQVAIDTWDDISWNNISALQTLNGYRADFTIVNGQRTLFVLGADDWGFAVPAGEGLVGILIQVFYAQTYSDCDYCVGITKDGTTVAGTLKQGACSNTGGVYVSFGGAADKWGATFSRAEVDAATFGCIVAYKNDGAVSRTFLVDHIQMTIYTATVYAPTVTTQAVTNIAKTTATGNGNVTNDGAADITERGVCYCLASHGTPDTGDSKQTKAGTTGAFTAEIIGLTPLTAYNARAYAINSEGTSYGDMYSFTTLISATYWEILTADRALTLDNTTAFTPSTDYNPATKKYVDDLKGALDGGAVMDTTGARMAIDLKGVIPDEQIEAIDGGLIADNNQTSINYDLGTP